MGLLDGQLLLAAGRHGHRIPPRSSTAPASGAGATGAAAGAAATSPASQSAAQALAMNSDSVQSCGGGGGGMETLCCGQET